MPFSFYSREEKLNGKLPADRPMASFAVQEHPRRPLIQVSVLEVSTLMGTASQAAPPDGVSVYAARARVLPQAVLSQKLSLVPRAGRSLPSVFLLACLSLEFVAEENIPGLPTDGESRQRNWEASGCEEKRVLVISE